MVYHDVNSFRPLLGYWSDMYGLRIIPAHYPKAPEADVAAILEVLVQQFEGFLLRSAKGVRVVLTGDSIGAYLALQLWRLVPHARVTGLILLYPVLDVGGSERPSYAAFGRGYALGLDNMRAFRALWKDVPHCQPFTLGAAANPLPQPMPAIYLASAGFDVLHDEAQAWCQLMQVRGAQIRHACFESLTHDFCLLAGAAPSCRRAVDMVGQAMAHMAIQGDGNENERARIFPAQAGA